MPNAKDVEELRFSYGDPRPTTAWYAKQVLQNVTCYHLHKKTLLLGNTNIMIYKCNGVKRSFKIPETKSFMKGLQNPLGYKIVLIPIKIYSKMKCKTADQTSARHMIYMIYNTITHELVRFDMRREQVSGFSIKNTINQIKKKFLPVMQTVVPDASLHQELEMAPTFAKKVSKSATLRDAFPIFSICYLDIVSKNPELTVEAAVSKTKNLSENLIAEIWNKYVQWYTTCENINNGNCKDTEVLNPENNRCMSFMSKTYKSHLIEKPSKPCEEDLVFDRLAEKCVLPSKLKAIDIFLGDVEGIKINKKTKFKYLGKFAYGFSALSIIISKFQYAKLIAPSNCSREDDCRIVWKKSKTTGEFSFQMSDKIWDVWNDAMVDPTLRFLVILIKLQLPGAGHANVLIYDKSSNELERFDPHGAHGTMFGDEELDKILTETWTKHIDESNIKMKRKFRFFNPSQYCPRKAYVFQAKESDDIFVSNSDSNGTCAVWRLWYIHVRLSNPNLTRKEVVSYASKKLNETGSVRNFIKMYQKYIAMLVSRGTKADPICKDDEIINTLTKRCVKKTSNIGKKMIEKAQS